MVLVLCLSAPVGVWYTGLLSYRWGRMDSLTHLCCSIVVLRALCGRLGTA